jgi:hypothetical protein
VLDWPAPSVYQYDATDRDGALEVEVKTNEEMLHDSKNGTRTTSEEDFIKIFAIPLIIVIFFLFLFSCCLFCVFKKIMTNYLTQEEA